MRLKIVYTGDPTETKIIDEETGEKVEGVHSVEVSIDAFSAYASIVLQDFILETSNVEGEVFEGEEAS
jgi:hypothetical protein|tara:strand:+ start:235 stop:438 length:204 start_codon:yes stop_codon:yes gene_type:complete